MLNKIENNLQLKHFDGSSQVRETSSKSANEMNHEMTLKLRNRMTTLFA